METKIIVPVPKLKLILRTGSAQQMFQNDPKKRQVVTFSNIFWADPVRRINFSTSFLHAIILVWSTIFQHVKMMYWNWFYERDLLKKYFKTLPNEFTWIIRKWLRCVTFVKRSKVFKIDENEHFCGRISLRKHQKCLTLEICGSNFWRHLNFCDWYLYENLEKKCRDLGISFLKKWKHEGKTYQI